MKDIIIQERGIMITIAKLFCAPYVYWAVCPSRDYRASVLCRSYSLTSKAWPEVINESGDLCAHSARKYLRNLNFILFAENIAGV